MAKKGTVIEGSVKPAIEGVLISATSREDQKVFRGKTDAFGKYRIGPVDDVEFAIEASFDDYSFSKLNARDFSVVRVPMIEVGCREDGFVKIVGRMGLTRQGLAKESGFIKFSHLEPDLYSVTCVHLDYKFENAEVMLLD